jgi:hypothetical protein
LVSFNPIRSAQRLFACVLMAWTPHCDPDAFIASPTNLLSNPRVVSLFVLLHILSEQLSTVDDISLSSGDVTLAIDDMIELQRVLKSVLLVLTPVSRINISRQLVNSRLNATLRTNGCAYRQFAHKSDKFSAEPTKRVVTSLATSVTVVELFNAQLTVVAVKVFQQLSERNSRLSFVPKAEMWSGLIRDEHQSTKAEIAVTASAFKNYPDTAIFYKCAVGLCFLWTLGFADKVGELTSFLIPIAIVVTGKLKSHID